MTARFAYSSPTTRQSRAPDCARCSPPIRGGSRGRVCGRCAAVRALRELRPDVAFLDVQMPALDGFAVLRQIEAEHVPTIVFVTAYDRYALRAFDAHAVDYLLKPFEDDRFRLALARAKERARAGCQCRAIA